MYWDVVILHSGILIIDIKIKAGLWFKLLFCDVAITTFVKQSLFYDVVLLGLVDILRT